MNQRLKKFLFAASAMTMVTAGLLPNIASAAHPPYVRVVRPRPVVIVRSAPPPPVYVVEQPPPRTVVVREEPRYLPPAERQNPLGIGFRFNTMALEGTKLDVTELENSAMPGFGIQLQSKISRHWGIELSVDYIQTADGDSSFAQHTVPVMLSPIFYLFPDSAINPYALFGIGVHFTTLEYMDGLFNHTLFEVAGQAGFGVQVKLGDSFAISADMRFLTIFKNIGERSEISSECYTSKAGGAYGFCDGLANLDTEDKMNFGMQFQVGGTYFF